MNWGIGSSETKRKVLLARNSWGGGDSGDKPEAISGIKTLYFVRGDKPLSSMLRKK